jgi:hypothetical protein
MPDRILQPERGYTRRPLVLIAFGALLAAAVTSAAIAKADPSDDDARFLHAIHGAGLVPKAGDGERIVINNAHLVCAAAWRGESTDAIAAEVDKVETSVDLAGAQTFVAISLMIYCPSIGARS